MKSIYYLIILTFSFSICIYAQETKSCCSPGEVENTRLSFAAFGSDAEFKDVHQIPAEYVLTNPKGKMIEIEISGGKHANAYFVKSANESDKYILVIHEWWGLNDHIKREADELNSKLGDVNVLALDLYDGSTADNREAASKLMQSADPDRIKMIFDAAVKYAGTDANIGTIGWCFGGGWSLQMSIWLGEKGKACVMYYGIIDNTPDTFKDLQAPVLGIFAKKDSWVNPEVYGNLEKNLKDAGKSVTIYEYDADHAFANPSNQHFDKEAAADAKKHSLAFFKQHLMN